MALLGTERSIVCPHCNSIEFTEETVITFSEALNIKKFREINAANGRQALRGIRYEYRCKSCGKKLE